MRCGLPVEAQSFSPTSSHEIAGRNKAGICFLLNLPGPWIQLPVTTGGLTFVVRLTYGKNVTFEVKWPVLGYNPIRRLLEALINFLLN